MSSARRSAWLLGLGALTSAASARLIWYSADKEPFLSFEPLDGVLHFAVAPLLIAAQVLWAVATARALSRWSSRPGRWVLLPVMLLWVTANVLLLGFTTQGYVADLEDPRLAPLVKP